MNAFEAPAAEEPTNSAPGNWDCHIHVFGPQSRFPFTDGRHYTPPDVDLDGYCRVMPTFGVKRAVLIAPSVHGVDNSALLHALTSDGPAVRGIVAIDKLPNDDTLKRWHEAGIRGMRANLKPRGASPMELPDLKVACAAVAELNWHLEVHIDVSAITDVDRLFYGFPIPVAIEHMGHMPTVRGTDDSGFQALLRFLRDGGWIKLSGPYINSRSGPPYDDVRPYVEALLDAAPKRAVWGSNWPHPHKDPVPNDPLIGRLIHEWLPTESLRHEVLQVAPVTLYDFESVTEDR